MDERRQEEEERRRAALMEMLEAGEQVEALLHTSEAVMKKYVCLTSKRLSAGSFHDLKRADSIMYRAINGYSTSNLITRDLALDITGRRTNKLTLQFRGDQERQASDQGLADPYLLRQPRPPEGNDGVPYAQVDPKVAKPRGTPERVQARRRRSGGRGGLRYSAHSSGRGLCLAERASPASGISSRQRRGRASEEQQPAPVRRSLSEARLGRRRKSEKQLFRAWRAQNGEMIAAAGEQFPRHRQPRSRSPG